MILATTITVLLLTGITASPIGSQQGDRYALTEKIELYNQGKKIVSFCCLELDIYVLGLGLLVG